MSCAPFGPKSTTVSVWGASVGHLCEGISLLQVGLGIGVESVGFHFGLSCHSFLHTSQCVGGSGASAEVSESVLIHPVLIQQHE